jgi:hypothetical protein
MVFRNVDFGSTTKDDLDCIEIVKGRPFQMSRDHKRPGMPLPSPFGSHQANHTPVRGVRCGPQSHVSCPDRSSLVVIEIVGKKKEAALLILFGTREWWFNKAKSMKRCAIS